MSSGQSVLTSQGRHEGGSISAQEELHGDPRSRNCHSSGADDADSKNYRSNTGDILQKVFAYFDINGDGKISPTELQSCVRTIGGDISSEDAEAAIMSSDTDEDGALSFEDFRRLMHQGSTADIEELRQAFQMYETKPGSGCISPCSLNRMLSRIGDPRSIEECKAMIRPFDLNGDGLLNFHEFSLMMH